VDQGEVVDKVHAGGNGEGVSKIDTQSVAGRQRQRRLKTQRSGTALGLALLVHPTHVITQYVVKKALSGLEHGPEFIFQGLSV
jgi:hypothetical protein